MNENKDGRFIIDKHLMPAKGKRNEDQRTWKLWGTGFLKELNEGQYPAISDYGSKPDLDIFEYFVKASDKWIGLVAPWHPPKWEILHDMTISSALRRYLKRI